MLSKNAKKVKRQLKKLIENFNNHNDTYWPYICYVSVCLILEDGSTQRITFPIIRKPSRSSFYYYGFRQVPFQIKDKLHSYTGNVNMVDFLKLLRRGNIVSDMNKDVLTYIVSEKEIHYRFADIFEIGGKLYKINNILVENMKSIDYGEIGWR